MDIGAGEPSPQKEVQPAFTSPRPSPAHAAEQTSVEIPPLVLNESK